MVVWRLIWGLGVVMVIVEWMNREVKVSRYIEKNGPLLGLAGQ